MNIKTEEAIAIADMFGQVRVQVTPTVGTNAVARMAVDFMTAMLRSGKPYGDNVTSQRQREIAQAANNACELAISMWQEFTDRGWTYDIPVPVQPHDEAAPVGGVTIPDGAVVSTVHSDGWSAEAEQANKDYFEANPEKDVGSSHADGDLKDANNV